GCGARRVHLPFTASTPCGGNSQQIQRQGWTSERVTSRSPRPSIAGLGTTGRAEFSEMSMRSLLALAMAVALVGCTTTEDANNAIQSRWIGRTTDDFFAQYGPPVRAYPMNSGGTIYTWHGGDKRRDIAPVYRDMTDAEKEAA